MIARSPREFILKPQDEGGNNNFFNDEILKKFE
jgi:hypothetical protein